MTIKEPRLRSLLTQADRNASNGKNAAAESIFRQILNEAPDAEEAWLGLAGVVWAYLPVILLARGSLSYLFEDQVLRNWSTIFVSVTGRCSVQFHASNCASITGYSFSSGGSHGLRR